MSYKFVTFGDVIRAVVTSVITAVLIVGAVYLLLYLIVPEQTPNGLGG